jgi:hypothetical protein
MERRNALILLSVVTLAAIMGGFAMSTYAVGNGDENNGLLNSNECSPRMRFSLQKRLGRYGSIEVSEEYEANVISVAEIDEDVLALFTDGYSVTRIKPLLKASIDVDGNVVVKATNAIVILEKDETNRAAVWVDIEADTVTKIVVFSKTIIEKS